MKTRTRRVYVTLALSVLTVIVCANSVLAQSTFRRRRRQSTATTTTNGTAIVNQTAPTDPTDPSATVIISDPTSVSDPTSPETAVSATTTLSDTAVSPANASLPRRLYRSQPRHQAKVYCLGQPLIPTTIRVWGFQTAGNWL